MESTTEYHRHHQISAAIFVGSIILGAAMVLSAELTKSPRYEYHQFSANDPNSYLIYDNETGRATAAKADSEHPLAPLNK